MRDAQEWYHEGDSRLIEEHLDFEATSTIDGEFSNMIMNNRGGVYTEDTDFEGSGVLNFLDLKEWKPLNYP